MRFAHGAQARILYEDARYYMNEYAVQLAARVAFCAAGPPLTARIGVGTPTARVISGRRGHI